MFDQGTGGEAGKALTEPAFLHPPHEASVLIPVSVGFNTHRLTTLDLFPLVVGVFVIVLLVICEVGVIQLVLLNQSLARHLEGDFISERFLFGEVVFSIHTSKGDK